MIVERMAGSLGLPTTFIESLARAATHEYKTYTIAKRTGGSRTIHHPSRRLKALQRWLLMNVIEGLPVHPSATAYRKRHSILDNARTHAASRYLLRMDLTDFFPSITQADLGKYIAQRPSLFSGWTPSDIDVVCRLVCRDSVLTIGAPSSPSLSNALCYDMDVALHALSEKNAVRYSRYADDLFFSTDQPNVLRETERGVSIAIFELKLPMNLKLNASKTRHSSKRGARRVTGIVLGSDGEPHIGRGLKRKIRSLVHRFESLDKSTRASLAGMIAYATRFGPGLHEQPDCKVWVACGA
jgi:RNA-directed DNA polymerase